MSPLSASTLVLGGARSGKSRFALALGNTQAGKKVYLATAEPGDTEMAARIEQHRQERGQDWETIESPFCLPETLQSLEDRADVVLLDCLTLWLSNLMMQTQNPQEISKKIAALIEIVPTLNFRLIAVSNEVGPGFVPAVALSRTFRDFAGLLHQQWATVVQEVYFMTAGIAQKIKGSV